MRASDVLSSGLHRGERPAWARPLDAVSLILVTPLSLAAGVLVLRRIVMYVNDDPNASGGATSS